MAIGLVCIFGVLRFCYGQTSDLGILRMVLKDAQMCLDERERNTKSYSFFKDSDVKQFR